MIFHLLNGDALKAEFPVHGIEGSVIVIREAFIEGPVSNSYDSTFWSERQAFIQKAYGDSSSHYKGYVMSEFNRLQSIANGDKVYLWFEDDLFCQFNMWFAVDYISKWSHPEFYRVFPEADTSQWKGFGIAGEKDLLTYFLQAVVLNDEDIHLIRMLWKAFVDKDQQALRQWSKKSCAGIRFLDQVIQAQLEREPDASGYGRPERLLKSLMSQGENDFYKIFEAFSRQEGIYGFGDTQVKNMLIELGGKIKS